MPASAPKDHFPKQYGDWVAAKKPLDWRPPAGPWAGESLLDGGAGLALFGPSGHGFVADPGDGPDWDVSPKDEDHDSDAKKPFDERPGAGGHTKIGAGHKQQTYDEHGRYTGPRGGSVSLTDGTVRMFGQD